MSGVGWLRVFQLCASSMRLLACAPFRWALEASSLTDASERLLEAPVKAAAKSLQRAFWGADSIIVYCVSVYIRQRLLSTSPLAPSSLARSFIENSSMLVRVYRRISINSSSILAITHSTFSPLDQRRRASRSTNLSCLRTAWSAHLLLSVVLVLCYC